MTDQMALYVVILLLGGCIGALLAWSPRLTTLRALRRLTLIEEFLVSDRNKRASRQRWEAPDAEMAKVLEMAKAEKAQALDNEFPTGKAW